MFKNALGSTPMTTEAANQYFADKIVGEQWLHDSTFLATLRALLAPRMGEGDKITLSFSTSNYRDDRLDRETPERNLYTIIERRPDVTDHIYLHNFTCVYDEDNSRWMEMVEKNFETCYKGYHRVAKVTDFYRKVFNVLCFIDPERKSVFLFTDQMDMRRMHYLQCGILAFMPWYFDPQKGVTEDEMELLRSLREKTSEAYIACLGRIASQYDFQTAQIKRLLRGFESRYEQTRCERMRNELASIDRNLDDLNQRMGDFLRKRRDTEATILGLELKITESADASEVMEYFLCHRNMLFLEDVSGSEMTFVVRSTLDYFDEQMAKRVIDNAHSYFYEIDGSKLRGDVTHADMKKLLTEIFVNQTLRIHTCAAYTLRMEGNASGLRDYEYGADCADCLPNPHINHYACLGTYAARINERLKDNDYIGAIEQCIASCKSLNFGDSSVMRRFSKALYGLEDRDNNRCIELPDGKIVTPKEAAAYLHEKGGI